MSIHVQLCGLVFATVLVLASNRVTAAPGDLDPSFGSGTGMVRDSVGTVGGQAHALVIDGSGRILVAGTAFTAVNDGAFGLLRLNANGSLDAGFGAGGRSTYHATTDSEEEAYGLILQENGKPVVAGVSSRIGPFSDFAALRLNEDGSVDTAFGNNGTGWMTSARAETDVGLALASASEGGFLLAGYVQAGSLVDAACLRLDSQGMPDSSFGTNGLVVAAADSNSFRATTSQSDGKVVLGGQIDNMGGAIVQRLDVNGNPDPGFAGDGRAELAGILDFVGDLRVLADGRILVAGRRLADATIVRLHADGSIDPTFGISGILKVGAAALGQATILLESVAIDASNRIVSVGNASSTMGAQVFAMRATASGQLDAGFGSAGSRLIGAAGDLFADAVAVQSDGAIVIAGSDRGADSATADDQYLVMRLQGGPTLCDSIFASDFDSPDAQTCP